MTDRDLAPASASAVAAIVATAATACCAPVLAPLLVSVLGVSGAIWAASLEPYTVPIISAAGLFIGYGFWTVRRPRPVAEGAACPRKPSPLVRVVLWTAASLWLVALSLLVSRQS